MSTQIFRKSRSWEANHRTEPLGASDDLDAALLRTLRLALAVTVHAGNNAEPELTPTQIRVLTLLAADAGEGMSVGAIAECLSLSPPSASRLCQRLVRDGLVLRDAGPGHHILISLSEAGARTLTAVNQQRVAPLRTMIDAMPVRARTAVSRALAELNRYAVSDLDLW